MDGWETRRKRIKGHDFCIIKLGLSGTIRSFEIDTAFFTGNHSPFVSIQGACLSDELDFNRKSEMGTCASLDDIAKVEALTASWKMLLPLSKLEPGYPETRFNRFNCTLNERITHLKVNMHPDGGIARLRVYGIVQIDWSKVSAEKSLDLACLENGGRAVSCSNAHYGQPMNLLSKDPSKGKNLQNNSRNV
jgi:allantoicase